MTVYKQVWNATRKLGKAGLQSWLRMFLAAGCAVCDRKTTQTFCVDCYRQIKSEFYPTSSQLANSQLARNPHSDVSNELAVGSLGTYQGTLKQAILSLKYKERPEVAHCLGVVMAESWQRQISQWPGPLYAIPIPLHSNRLAQRGYNQAALIARAFCQASDLCLAEHALIRCADTKPQHQLGSDARQENLASAFELSAAWQKKQRRSGVSPNVLLIDDIYTTGATARSAAMTLREAGVSVLGILTLARAVSD